MDGPMKNACQNLRAIISSQDFSGERAHIGHVQSRPKTSEDGTLGGCPLGREVKSAAGGPRVPLWITRGDIELSACKARTRKNVRGYERNCIDGSSTYVIRWTGKRSRQDFAVVERKNA